MVILPVYGQFLLLLSVESTFLYDLWCSSVLNTLEVISVIFMADDLVN